MKNVSSSRHLFGDCEISTTDVAYPFTGRFQNKITDWDEYSQNSQQLFDLYRKVNTVNRQYGKISHKIRKYVMNCLPAGHYLTFTKCIPPLINPNYKSLNRSHYWYFEKEGVHYFIRESDHWSNYHGGLGDKNYFWFLENNKKHERACGYVAFSDALLNEYFEGYEYTRM